MWESKTEVYVHLVWSTYDRLPLISSDVERSLCRWLYRVAQEMGCGAVAVGCAVDHVHVLVRMSPTRTVAEVAKRLKGSSSRLLNERCESVAWFRWQRGYGAFSVSRWDLKRVAAYVRNQKEHHARGTDIGFLEPSDRGAGNP